MAPPVRATGTLTSTGTIPTAADTVTIGGQVYTFRAAVGTTANEVLLGADATAAMTNLFRAINLGTGSGTSYGSNTTLHDLVVATNPTALTVVATAKVPGTIGNLINTSEASSQLSWGATTLAGGTSSVHAYVDEILAQSQVNADVITDLRSIQGP